MSKIIKCHDCGCDIEVGDRVNLAKCAACKEKTLRKRAERKDKEYRNIPVAKCKVCGKEFNYDWRSNWEIRRDKKLEFCCESCAKKYATSFAMQKAKTTRKEAICIKCKNSFLVHIRVSIKNFICEDCREKIKKESFIKNLKNYKEKDITANLLSNRSLYTLGRTCKICGKPIRDKNKTGLCHQCLFTTDEGKLICSIASKERMEKGFSRPWIPRSEVSYPEQYWRNVLDNEGIQYKTNYKVLSYFLDFYIEKNGTLIDLEIDGKQHDKEHEMV